MLEPPLAPNEPVRLSALQGTQLLDTPIEERFEAVTRLACRLFDVPISAVSLVDANRQWFKSIQGLNASETSRCVSFCGHTILQDDIFVVPNALEDERFHDNPLVAGDPGIRFYAGCPLRAVDGSQIASLCIIDRKPRELSHEDKQMLRDLGRMIEQQMVSNPFRSAQAMLISRVAPEERDQLTDPLTRVWSRQGIHALFEQELADANHSQTCCSVVLTHIDGFDTIQAEHSPEFIDELTRQVARRFFSVVRATDGVGRVDDARFMIVLGQPGCPSEALTVAETLRHRLAEAPLNIDGQPVNVTASFGIACLSAGESAQADDLIRAASVALSQAQQTRNHVGVAPYDQAA